MAMVLPSFAANSACVVTSSNYRKGKVTRVIDFAWTADDTDGSFNGTTTSCTYTLNAGLMGQFVQIVTNPGSTAPTTNYDVTITDSNGADIALSLAIDRSATATELIVPTARFTGTLTLNITGNSVNSAVGVVSVVYDKLL
jgi:hypothetical protein